MNKINILIGFVILLVIAISVYLLIYIRTKKKKIANLAAATLWLDEDKSMSEPYILENVSTEDYVATEDSTNAGVAYAMNINIIKWMYDNKIKYREIFTHGIGQFGNLSNLDIISVAIDANKNDIVIEVNTTFIDDVQLQLDRCRQGYGPDIEEETNIEEIVEEIDEQEDCEDTCVEKCKLKNIIEDFKVGRPSPYKNVKLPKPVLPKRKIERIRIKYFPLSEYFHLVIVLTKKRIDAYMNGKLYDSLIFRRNVFVSGATGLPIRFFHGDPIRGHIANFMYFNQELTIPKVKNIYSISNSSSEKLPDDELQDLIKSSDCGMSAKTYITDTRSSLTKNYNNILELKQKQFDLSTQTIEEVEIVPNEGDSI